jgi:hypothetical protein
MTFPMPMCFDEGMKKVRDVIEKNRKRKLAKHKKLSNQEIQQLYEKLEACGERLIENKECFKIM